MTLLLSNATTAECRRFKNAASLKRYCYQALLLTSAAADKRKLLTSAAANKAAADKRCC
jgi:hypothetical protein